MVSDQWSLFIEADLQAYHKTRCTALHLANEVSCMIWSVPVDVFREVFDTRDCERFVDAAKRRGQCTVSNDVNNPVIAAPLRWTRLLSA